MDQYDRPDHACFDPHFDRVLLTTPQHDVVEAVLATVQRGIALVVVTGDPGSGRSTVADHLAGALRGQGMRVDHALLPNDLMPENLLARAASLLDLDPALLARAALPPAPVMVTTDPMRAAAVIVDDADAWPPGLLRMLLGLARVRLIDGPLLHVILLGQATSLQPALCAETLPLHASLRILPLSLAQSRAYLFRRLAELPPASARLSARAANNILARAGGSPEQIGRLVSECLAPQQGAGTASASTTPFRKAVVPRSLLASLLAVALGVAVTLLLPHRAITPVPSDPTLHPAHVIGLPMSRDVARPTPSPNCLETFRGIAKETNGTERHTPPDPSCPPMPVRLHPLGPVLPMPPLATPPAKPDITPQSLLIHAPVVIGAEYALWAVTPGMSSLVAPPSPPRINQLPVLKHSPVPNRTSVAAAGTSATGGAAGWKMPIPPRPPAETVAASRGVPGGAASPGNGSVRGQTHPGLLPAQPGASALWTARAPDPNQAGPRVMGRTHDALPGQSSLGIPADRGGIRDNPAGLVSRADVPYFCDAVRPGNPAETAYIRQVCSH